MHRRAFLRNTTAAGLGGMVGLAIPALGEATALEQRTATTRSSSMTFSTDFEGGSLGKVIKVTDTYTRCILLGEVDQFGRNRQVSWFYFRIDNAQDKELTIDFTDLGGEYNFHPGNYAITSGTPCVYSYDNQHWAHVEKKSWTAVGSSRVLVRLRMRPAKSRLWLAHLAPYTNRNLARLLDSIKGADGLKYEVIGKSVQGRDLPMLTITDPRSSHERKKVVWLMFRQHSWESGSSWVGEGAVRFLLSSDPIAARIRQDTVFKILPIQDPDGVFRGGVRYNCYGYDLNRNWGLTDPVKMPEITAARNTIFNWVDQGHRIDFFLSLHNTQTGEFLDGPPSPKFRSLRERALEELKRSTTFDPSHSYEGGHHKGTQPKPPPDRWSVVGGLYYKRSIPAFLMEQKIAYDSKLGRCPTVDDRLEFGKGLVKAIWASLKT